jgi:hypothetical protein
VAISINIDGTVHEVPDEDDWELGEVGEVEKLRAEYGDAIGSLIGTAWMVIHRNNPAFTIADAKRIKVGGISDVHEVADPLPQSPAPLSDTGSNGGERSLSGEDAPSGIPSISVSTGSNPGT